MSPSVVDFIATLELPNVSVPFYLGLPFPEYAVTH
jgi:hypothetical protein